jgi:hypothetical protein
VREGIVSENILCRDGEHAERVFLDKLAECLSNWDEYDQDDRDAVLDNGYEQFGNGSVCLSWASSPDEDDEKASPTIVQTAIEGLVEHYPQLKRKSIAAAVHKAVKVPDTGNSQADYENVRNQIEVFLNKRS